jgi:hypothetical protein
MMPNRSTETFLGRLAFLRPVNGYATRTRNCGLKR